MDKKIELELAQYRYEKLKEEQEKLRFKSEWLSCMGVIYAVGAGVVATLGFHTPIEQILALIAGTMLAMVAFYIGAEWYEASLKVRE